MHLTICNVFCVHKHETAAFYKFIFLWILDPAQSIASSVSASYFACWPPVNNNGALHALKISSRVPTGTARHVMSRLSKQTRWIVESATVRCSRRGDAAVFKIHNNTHFAAYSSHTKGPSHDAWHCHVSCKKKKTKKKQRNVLPSLRRQRERGTPAAGLHFSLRAISG